MVDCSQCVNKSTCLTKNRVPNCANFRTEADTCENCVYFNNCILSEFFDYCNKYKPKTNAEK